MRKDTEFKVFCKYTDRCANYEYRCRNCKWNGREYPGDIDQFKGIQKRGKYQILTKNRLGGTSIEYLTGKLQRANERKKDRAVEREMKNNGEIQTEYGFNWGESEVKRYKNLVNEQGRR